VRRRTVLAAAALPLAGCSPRREVPGGLAGADPARGHLLRTATAVSGTRAVRRTQVVIAGGGIAGLAAARALRQRGVEDFVLLELEDQPGGNSRPGQLGGRPCPLGAHYLPLPGADAVEVQDLLEELGLRRRVAGRWTYDERHLCHSPQERLYFQGEWQDGLLPLQGVAEATLDQYRRFARLVAQAGRFALPAARAPQQADLDAITFAEWLQRQRLDDPHLRWYLDYCCRDDYGAGPSGVSAWAGLHYFGSRHGFHAPGEAEDASPPLTWAEGNGWLVRRLAQPLGDRVRAARAVVQVREERHGVSVEAIDARSGEGEWWEAAHVVIALPAFIASRVVEAVPDFLRQAARRTRYAPWTVANLLLREPLDDRPGAAPAWDNVIHGGSGLGYVDASHQRLDPRPGPTVLSWYCAPGEAARGELLQAPWTLWRDRAIAELAGAHPDLADKLERVEIARYGHAMAIPVPGTRERLADLPLHGALVSYSHADWAGYSVFEEAFTFGHLAGLHAAGGRLSPASALRSRPPSPARRA